MLTIKTLLNKYKNLEIELFLAHILKKPKEFLYLHPEISLSSHQVKSLSSLINRRKKGEPVAYILGYKDFMGLRFKVNKNVLIPRPETEELVEQVLSVIASRAKQSKKRLPRLYEPRNDKIRILDLGTGSGCIAISLAKILPSIIHNSRFILYASDISKKALEVARANARTHKAKINFIRSYLLENTKKNFDIIVANLPYGWKEWKNNTSADSVGLKFEPSVSLFTKEKGLYLYRKLFEEIKKSKHKPRLIFLEFDPRQKLLLKILIKKFLTNAEVKFYKDLSSLWRFAEINLE